jgi:glucose-1-phosphate thymidylyltransferase
MLDMNLAYLMMRLPFGAPYTLDQAYPFVQDSLVAFGFPDIIFQPDNAFVQLLMRQAATNADVVLGLFPAPNPQKMDMVALDKEGRVRQIVIKPQQTELHYTWIIAVWSPAFSHFMHDYLAAQEKEPANNGHHAAKRRELYVGHVFQAAIDQNLAVEAVVFPHATCLDIGTPDDLAKAVGNVNGIL